MHAKLLRLVLRGAVATALATTAHALSEGELAEAYDRLLRTVAEGGEAGDFRGVDGVRVHYRIHAAEEARGAIVLLPGCAESSLKYAEAIHDLNAAGYSVYALDHRGTGRSERLTANPQVVHVERFTDYIDDAETFVNEVVAPRESGPVHMLGHSTGALVGAMLLARGPGPFVSAAFTSPFFQMQTGDQPEWQLYLTASLNNLRGAGEDYAPGRRDWNPALATFATNRTTLSRVRWEIEQGQLRDHPEIVMGGPSNRWVQEALRATWARDEHARGIGGLPILVLQAEEDYFVQAYGQRRFCDVAESCRLVRIPVSRHELLMEQDAARDQVMAEILAHFGAAEER